MNRAGSFSVNSKALPPTIVRLKTTLVLLAFLAVGCVQPKSRSDLEEVPISVPLVADVVPHESLHYGNVAIPSAKSQAELYFYVGGAVRAPGRYEWQDGMN